MWYSSRTLLVGVFRSHLGSFSNSMDCKQCKGNAFVELIRSQTDAIHNYCNCFIQTKIYNRISRSRKIWKFFCKLREKVTEFNEESLKIYVLRIAVKSEGIFNSLWPGDVIWWQESRSTLNQVMACCLTAPSHYLNQCWLMISEVLWHSPDSNFTENTSVIYGWNEFEIY